MVEVEGDSRTQVLCVGEMKKKKNGEELYLGKEEEKTKGGM